MTKPIHLPVENFYFPPHPLKQPHVLLDPAQILGDLPARLAALEHHTHLICTGDKNDEDAWHQTNEPMTTGGGSASGIDPCPTKQQDAKPFLCPHCGKECKTWFDRTMDEQGRMATRCEHCGCDVGEDAKPLPPQEHTTKQQDAKPSRCPECRSTAICDVPCSEVAIHTTMIAAQKDAIAARADANALAEALRKCLSYFDGPPERYDDFTETLAAHDARRAGK